MTQSNHDQSSQILDAFLRPKGGAVNRQNLKRANACLPKLRNIKSVREILSNSELASVRLQVIAGLLRSKQPRA